jgi:hypothetical protein
MPFNKEAFGKVGSDGFRVVEVFFMVHIHTTAAAVSKLKKQAKIRSRGTGESHSQALDNVAASAGYADWRHVLLCAEKSGVSDTSCDSAKGLTVQDVYGEPVWLKTPSTGFLTLIRGRPGTGKTLEVMRQLIEASAAGKHCVVIDHGGSFVEMAKVIGGTVVRLLPNGGIAAPERFGDAKFFVYETERMGQETRSGPLPGLLESGFNAQEAFVAVDEVSYTAKRIGTLEELVAEVVAAGGSAALCGQEGWDSEFWEPYLLLPGKKFAMEMRPSLFDRATEIAIARREHEEGQRKLIAG